MADKFGVVLMNYGGPESLDEVRPYLENIFRDPLIIQLPWLVSPLQVPLAKFIAWRRAPYSIENFRAIGGKSPLNELTELQRAALEAELRRRGLDAVVVTAQRYWRPRADAAATALRAAGVTRGVLLPLYPQFARATTLSSGEDFLASWSAAGGKREDFTLVREYPEQPAMIAAIAAQMRETIAQLPPAELEKTGIIFSAHGLPQKMIDRGETYVESVKKSAAAVVRALDWNGHWDFAFQSRVGPVQWVKPYPLDTIQDFRLRELSHAVVYPITFVSDHSETLYELDLLWGPQAEAKGLRWHRVAALNDHPGFITALADLAAQAAR
jgi:ferrochelatase